MNSDIKTNVYQLGIILAVFCGKLVNLAIKNDQSALEAAEDSCDVLQDVINALGISIMLPNPKDKEAILIFFNSHLSKLTMAIGDRLAILYSREISNIFHFSTAIAGYLQTSEQASSSKDMEVLKGSIRRQAKDLNIKPSTVDAFLETPSGEWDYIVTELLHEDQSIGEVLNQVIEIKPNIAGIGLNLNKAGEVILKWFKKGYRANSR